MKDDSLFCKGYRAIINYIRRNSDKKPINERKPLFGIYNKFEYFSSAKKEEFPIKTNPRGFAIDDYFFEGD